MRIVSSSYFLNSIVVFLFASLLATAQTSTPNAPSASARPATADSLPSEATVDAFMRQQFGYQTDLSWKISGIKPSIIPGLADVTVVVASPQGQQLTRFFVS